MISSINNWDKKKVGVIGTGYWGRKHVEEYKKIGIIPVVYDKDPKKRQEMKDLYQVQTVATLEELLTDNTIIGASICTPNNTHHEVASRVIEAGKHLLLEKPMTLNFETSIDLIQKAEKHKVILSVGHLFRFNNAVRHLRELIHKEKLGQVYMVKLNWSNLEPIFENRDVLFDLAPHPFDILDFIFDQQIDQISCIGKAFRKQEGEEAVFLNGMIGDILVHLEVNWLSLPKSREIIVTGEFGSIIVDTMKQTLDVINNGHSYSPDIIPSNTIQEELIHFAKCINEGEDSLVDGMTGARIVKTIELARQSLKNRITVYRELENDGIITH